jgi:oligoribonuclease NrnB/cAMP/cGMP phosphodiesterase (DHH superfamily)
MLNLSQVQKVTTIVVHDNCPDGLAASILLRDAFRMWGKDPEIVFCQHNTDLHKGLIPRSGVLFADFAPYIETEELIVDGKKGRVFTNKGQETLQAWVDSGSFILDHHKTSKGVVDPFVAKGTGVYGDEKLNPGACGASLVFEHVWEPLLHQVEELGAEVDYVTKNFAPRFARLAGIRDTWQKRSPEFHEASLQAETLMFFWDRWAFLRLSQIAAKWDQDFRPVGEVLMDKQAKSVAKIVENAYRFTTTRGTRVVAFSDLRKSSDVAEALGDTADLVVGFMYVTDPDPATGERLPKFLLSTRSHTGYNCAALAALYAGGGHTAAAGFNRPVFAADPQPFEMLRQLVEAFENPQISTTGYKYPPSRL